MPRITVIEPTINPNTQTSIYLLKKRRVAAYARVSTEQEEQESSYEAQKEYYDKFIKQREDWDFVEIYADRGITGTSTKKRDGFNKMIEDALSGKIDLIITKSISRFARNTLDTISKVRALKAKNVEVYFEKENIWTFDPKSELIMTIMASIAQEESRSISQNVTWGKRAAFKNGKVSIAYSRFLGYKKGDDGSIQIDIKEAELVRKIYTWFLREGLTPHAICELLMKDGVETVTRSKKWTKTTILSILTNEKYKGDALLQKSYIKDYLEHKAVKNNGVLPQYYVENSHEAIIEREEWDMVQAEIARREKIGTSYSSSGIFSAKLICEDCGSFYGRKTWHSTDIYKRVVYQCNHKFDYKKECFCKTPHFTEEQIIKKYLEAYNQVMANKEKVVEDLRELALVLGDTTSFESSIQDLKNQHQINEAMLQMLIDKRSKTDEISEEEFKRQYEELMAEQEKLKNKVLKKKQDLDIQIGKKNRILAIAKMLEDSPEKILEWNKETWMLTVESATIHKDRTITFKFYGGQKVRV